MTSIDPLYLIELDLNNLDSNQKTKKQLLYLKIKLKEVIIQVCNYERKQDDK